ncbi:hypothetical protein D1007_41493 [Hordeum vulgare]|nr:hypothetical protein D1007_41493 [Hordeum vulgare]
MSRRADPSIGPANFESHREQVVRHGKEWIRIVEAYHAEEMAVAEAADAAVSAATEEEAIRARIFKKRQRRNTCAVAGKHNRTVHEMARLPSKEEKEVSDSENNSDDEQIRLDPYRVFDRYFRDKGVGKDKGSRG